MRKIYWIMDGHWFMSRHFNLKAAEKELSEYQWAPGPTLYEVKQLKPKKLRGRNE